MKFREMNDFFVKITDFFSKIGDFFANLFCKGDSHQNEKSCQCPCGEGLIILSHSESGSELNICCEKCRKMYNAEIVSGYYLVPVAIPKYTGYTVDDSFAKAPKGNKNPIIENYTIAVLKEVLEDMEGVTASSKVQGIGADIVKLHKKMYGSVKLDLVREWIETSIAEYPYYEYGSHEQRISLLQREKYERDIYEKKIQSMKIPLSF